MKNVINRALVAEKKITSFLFMLLAAMTMNAKTIYCQMPYDWWWAGDGQGNTAAISLYAYGDSGSNADWPGQLMTEVDATQHIWSIDFDLTGYNAIIFARSSQNNDNWGAKTKDLPVSEIGDNDLFVISSADAVWGDPGCDGSWTVYGQGEPVTYNTYHIYVTNNTGWETFFLYEWGTPNEITGGWPGAQGNDFTFNAAEGAEVTLYLIFHNNVGQGQEGDHRQLFNITEARDYNLIVTNEGVTEVPAISTDINQPLIPSTGRSGEVSKILYNGQILLLSDNKIYTAQGALLKTIY